MIPDGDYTAVVDRVEDNLAVLELTTEDGDRYERVVPVDDLPDAGRHADAVLAVTVVDETLAAVSYDPVETRDRQGAAQDRFDRLSERPPRDEDDDDCEERPG
jgi:hypothetical protein